MAENVPVAGFGVPPLPPSANVSERPNAGNMQPGFVPPAAPAPNPAPAAAPAPAGTTYSQEQVDAMLAAALGKQAAPAAPTPLLTPSAAITAPELSQATDPVLSSMTNAFLAMGTGIDVDRAIGKALAYGDPALIDLAYINEKGGANAANLAAVAKGIIDRVQTQAAAGEAAAYGVAGGKDNWHTAAAVFDKSAPAHTKLVIKQMLDSGNSESIAAAAQTIVEFAKSSGRMPVVPGLVQAGAANTDAAMALDKAGFQTALRSLKPNDAGFEAARAQLFQRRSLGKSLGM